MMGLEHKVEYNVFINVKSHFTALTSCVGKKTIVVVLFKFGFEFKLLSIAYQNLDSPFLRWNIKINSPVCSSCTTITSSTTEFSKRSRWSRRQIIATTIKLILISCFQQSLLKVVWTSISNDTRVRKVDRRETFDHLDHKLQKVWSLNVINSNSRLLDKIYESGGRPLPLFKLSGKKGQRNSSDSGSTLLRSETGYSQVDLFEK